MGPKNKRYLPGSNGFAIQASTSLLLKEHCSCTRSQHTLLLEHVEVGSSFLVARSLRPLRYATGFESMLRTVASAVESTLESSGIAMLRPLASKSLSRKVTFEFW